MQTMSLRNYAELSRLKSFNERYNYLRLSARVGVSTFGFDRYLNQKFYRSVEWRRVRDEVIIRDGGNDLGIDGHPIFTRGYIHHMNPIAVGQLIDFDPNVLDPNQLVLCSFATHNAIHFGVTDAFNQNGRERSPGDTKLW